MNEYKSISSKRNSLSFTLGLDFRMSQYQKYHNTFFLSLQNAAFSIVFIFSWDLQWFKEKLEQCLRKILEVQTKSIMVFLILAN